MAKLTKLKGLKLKKFKGSLSLKKKGWQFEGTRHGLAAKGIKTYRKKKEHNTIFIGKHYKDNIEEYREKGQDADFIKYKQIAKDKGFNSLEQEQFVQFIQNRFPHTSAGYAEQWADRINEGIAWGAADKYTKKELLKSGFSASRLGEAFKREDKKGKVEETYLTYKKNPFKEKTLYKASKEYRSAAATAGAIKRYSKYAETKEKAKRIKFIKKYAPKKYKKSFAAIAGMKITKKQKSAYFKKQLKRV